MLTHKSRLNSDKHFNQHLQRAWKKYGAENFEFKEVTTALTREDLNFLEKIYVEQIGYYNIKEGGSPKHRVGHFKQTEKAKKILSEKNTGTNHPQCRLTEEEIFFIKFIPDYSKWGETAKVHRLFNLDRAYVWRILNERWNWINENAFDKKEIFSKIRDKLNNKKVTLWNKEIDFFSEIEKRFQWQLK